MLLDKLEMTTPVTPAWPNEPLPEVIAAIRLGLKVATLRAWRHKGRGPAYVRLGRAIRYLPDDLDDFLRANRYSRDSRGPK